MLKTHRIYKNTVGYVCEGKELEKKIANRKLTIHLIFNLFDFFINRDTYHDLHSNECMSEMNIIFFKMSLK